MDLPAVILFRPRFRGLWSFDVVSFPKKIPSVRVVIWPSHPLLCLGEEGETFNDVEDSPERDPKIEM